MVSFLLARGYTSARTWAVVGNGPISLADRAQIARADIIVRFNDANNMWSTERTDLHVVRHPSWYSLKTIDAPVWDMGPLRSSIPRQSLLFTYVYERQHGSHNVLSDTARIFQNCRCGPTCLSNSTWAGPSTGAAALSVLEELPDVTSIDVFGFNGLGDAQMHTDFKNRSILPLCCTKCTLHKTRTLSYGASAAVATLATLGGMALLACLFVTYCMGKVVQKVAHDSKKTTVRPLLALPAAEPPAA